MKIFMAGGTGNMGQNTTKLLLDAGHELVMLTRTPDRIPWLAEHPQVSFVKGGIHDYDAIREGLKGCEAVITFALNMKGTTPLEILESEVKGLVFLLQAAEEAGVQKFIYTSTVATMTTQFSEEQAIKPWGLYGAAKGSNEAFVLGFEEYFAGFDGAQGKKVSMKRNVVRPGETFSNPAFPGGAAESYRLIYDIVEHVYYNQDMTIDINHGAQWAAGKQVAQIYKAVLDSDCNEEIFIAVGGKWQTNYDLFCMAKELLPESTAKATVVGTKRRPWYKSTEHVDKAFGIHYGGDEYMREHMQWIIDRLRAKDAGEEVYDTNHSK